jgi:hypothetical protein
MVEGSPRANTAAVFKSANRICKFMWGPWYADSWKLTRNTALLPRDLIISALYGRMFQFLGPNGEQINSMASRRDVSQALDVLGSTEGKTLIRGEKWWEQADPVAVTHDYATLYLSANKTGFNMGSYVQFTFTQADDPTGLFTNLGANAGRITIPAGYSFARLTGQYGTTNAPSTSALTLQITATLAAGGAHNASKIVPGLSGYMRDQIVSAILPVAEGDYFEFYGSKGGATSATLESYWNWFNVEAW